MVASSGGTGHGAIDAALAFFQGLEGEAMGFQVHAVSGQRQALRQATPGISQHMTECLHVAGKASGRLQKRCTLLPRQVFAAAVGMKEFS